MGDIQRIDTDFGPNVAKLLGEASRVLEPKVMTFNYVPPTNFFKCNIPTIEIDNIPIKRGTPVTKIEELVSPSLVGHQSGELLDVSVRNSSSTVKNHKISFAYKRITDILGQICGTSNPLRLEFNKLIIYKSGGFFLEHTDRVKGENHLGSVLIGTNYTYEGGQVVLNHNGEEKRYVLNGNQHLFIPLGVPHRVEKILKGSRVVLQFGLYYDDGQKNNCETIVDNSFKTGRIRINTKRELDDEEEEANVNNMYSFFGLLSAASKVKKAIPDAARAWQYCEYIQDKQLDFFGIFLGNRNITDPFYNQLVEFYRGKKYKVTLTSVIITVYNSDDCDYKFRDYTVTGSSNIENLPSNYFVDNYNFGALPICVLKGSYRQYNDEGPYGTKHDMYSSNVVIVEKRTIVKKQKGCPYPVRRFYSVAR